MELELFQLSFLATFIQRANSQTQVTRLTSLQVESEDVGNNEEPTKVSRFYLNQST